MKQNRLWGFLVIAIVYTLAICLAIILFRALPEMHILLRILLCDIGATVFVFLAGWLLQNASLYDPYWSVAPLVVFMGLVLHFDTVSQGTPLLLAAIGFWGIRLTCNWAYTFKNLATQDWRYDKLQAKFPRIFPLISLWGIHLFPTLVVFLCMLPGIALLQNFFFDPFIYLGFAICICATLLQLIADTQMHRFRRANADRQQPIRIGLWKHARHPNYLGEILMWWGVYAMMLAVAPNLWFLGIGAFVNTLMFFFVSIPMADARNRERYPAFSEYYRARNHLLPIRIKRGM